MMSSIIDKIKNVPDKHLLSTNDLIDLYNKYSRSSNNIYSTIQLTSPQKRFKELRTLLFECNITEMSESDIAWSCGTNEIQHTKHSKCTCGYGIDLSLETKKQCTRRLAKREYTTLLRNNK